MCCRLHREWSAVNIAADDPRRGLKTSAVRAMAAGWPCTDDADVAAAAVVAAFRVAVADGRTVAEATDGPGTVAARRPLHRWNEVAALKAMLAGEADLAAAARRLVEEFSSPCETSSLPVVEVNGVRLGNVGIARASGGRADNGSLVLTTPTPALSTVLRIPASELFNVNELVRHCALGKALASRPDFFEELFGRREDTLLIVCLMFEAFVIGAKDSRWAKVLLEAPTEVQHFPIAWPAHAVPLLHGTPLLDEVLAARESVERFATELHAVVPQMAELVGIGTETLSSAFSVERCVWAKCVIDSRAFALSRNGQIRLALAPIAGMMNHSATCNDVWYREWNSDGSLTLRCGPELCEGRVGSELWTQYGPLSNAELLLSYGFTLERNPYDRLTISLDTANLTNEQRTTAEAASLPLTGEGLCVLPDGSPTAVLLATVRLMLGGEVDSPEMLYRPDKALDFDVWTAIASVVEATMDDLLDDDEDVDEDVAPLAKVVRVWKDHLREIAASFRRLMQQRYPAAQLN